MERDPSGGCANRELAESPLADRVEWATFSILSTAGRLDEEGFMDRIYSSLPRAQAPDEELVRACLSAYAQHRRARPLGTERTSRRASEDHARMIAACWPTTAIGLDYGSGSAGASRQRADRVGTARRPAARRRAAGLSAARDCAPGRALGAVDVIWYVRGQARLPLRGRVDRHARRRGAAPWRDASRPGSSRPASSSFPAERDELVRFKLERSPWLRARGRSARTGTS